MKKLLMSIAVLAFFSMSANAQLLVGGRVSYSSQGTKNTYKDFNDKTQESKSVTTSFSLAPQVGFELSEKLEVGGIISLGSTKSYADKANDKDNWSKTVSFAVSPYAQFTFASFGKFNLKAEAVASVGQTIPSRKSGKEKIDGDKTTTLSLGAYPIISYDLNDNIVLEAELDFFGLSASSSITKDADDSDRKTVDNYFGLSASSSITKDADDSDRKTVDNYFGLSANSNNIATTGFITVGFLYRF